MTPARLLRVVTATALLAEPEPVHDDLVDGLYPAAGVVMQAGDPKSFKTLEALQLALCVASRSALFGRDTRGGPCLFIEEEGSRAKLRERIRMMSAGLGIDVPADLVFSLHEGVRLDEASSVDRIAAVARELRPVLIVADPLTLLHGLDENRASEMARVMRPLIGLAAELDTCVVVVHHTSKPQAERKLPRLAQRMRGSSAFAGATDANIIMDRDGDRTARLRAEFRDAEPLELYLELDPATLLLALTDAPLAMRKIGRDELLAYVSERGQVGVTLTAERFGVTRNTARTALSDLVAIGRLDFAANGRRGDSYFLVGASSGQ